MVREDLYNVYLTVNGSDGTTHTLQVDKSSGAGVKSKPTHYRPANGLENMLSLGGPREVEDGNYQRLYDTTVDPICHWLLTQAGRASVVVVKQPLDLNGHPFGTPLVYTGKLDDVQPPDTDSESEKAALIKFKCSLETNIG